MSKKLQKYREFRMLMSGGHDKLSAIDQAVILAHTVNTQFGLQCINRNGDKIEYPAEWISPQSIQQGVYKFQYLHKDRNILFRFVNCDDKRLSINFVPEDSQQLYQAEIQYPENQEEIQGAMKRYEKQLEKLNKSFFKESVHEGQKVRRLQPVWRSPEIISPNRPMIIQPRNSQNPLQIPFQSGGEYVGPNSNLFKGGMNGGYPNMQGPQNMRKPPGARYDPTNPFGIDEDNPRTNDFTGFNEWGVPNNGNNGFNHFG